MGITAKGQKEYNIKKFPNLLDSTMNVNSEAPLQAFDRASLTPLVRRALESENVEIIEWEYDPLFGGAGDMGLGLSGVYRFHGSALDRDKTLPWSLILKICNSSIGGNDPADWDFWKRELLIYQSGLLDDLPLSLAVPRCFGTLEQKNDVYWLWLEDIVDQIGSQWPLERYGLAARHLGQFNGAYLRQQALPVEPWLSKGWLRRLVAQAGPTVDQLPSYLSDPLVRRWLSTPAVNDILVLWAERELFLSTLDRLPQTFCHRDAFRRNLFARSREDGREQTVVIDWAFAGIGAIGIEIAPLVAASLCFWEVDLADAQALDDIIFDGFLKGLGDAGWHGNSDEVRFGYTAAAALIYCIGYLGYVLDSLLDESRHAWLEQISGRPLEETLDYWADINDFLLKLAKEARKLMRRLNPI